MNMYLGSIIVCFSISFLVAVTGQITCPACSDPYDPTSCTETQHCHMHDICELHVHLADRNRVEYICHNSHACVNQETHPCNPSTHETCTFCCNSLQACAAERQDLFTNRFTVAGHTLLPTTALPTAFPTAIPTTNSPIFANANRCIRCDTTPCDEQAVQSLQAVQCPASQPYCFSEIVQDSFGRSVSRGCADENFCRTKWWDYSSVATLCRGSFIPTQYELDCTFCCQGDACNRDAKPAQHTLVNF